MKAFAITLAVVGFYAIAEATPLLSSVIDAIAK